MMIGLGSILKLAKSGIGADELAEILAAAGMKLDFSPAEPSVASFQPLAQSS
jgi:hypothetical protein